MVDAYPTLTHKPMLTGSLTIIPNVIKSQFLGGFTAISQNGRKAFFRELTIEQPLNSDAEFVTLQTFIQTHVAASFTIIYYDQDKTEATTLTVAFNGNQSYSTIGGQSLMSIPVREV